MTAYIMTLTQAGLAAIVNVQAGTIGPVEIAQIGLTDATFTVASTLEALPGEIKRVAVSGDTLGDDLIHLTALDGSADAYGYRGFALYTSTGLLFAVYGQADRIAEKTPGAVSFIALDIAMARGQADAITFGNTDFINPPATTDQQGVVELATNAEASAGTDALRAITPASMQAALLAQLLRVHGAGSGINADLLDGQHGAWYADIVSRLGYVPFDSMGFTGAAILTLLRAVDGSGSDLDADLLDGKHAAAFVLAQDAATFGVTANGYWEKRPNGVIEQWGHASASTGANTYQGTFAFPIPFTDLASVTVTGNLTAGPNGAWGAATFAGKATDLSNASYTVDSANSGQGFGSGFTAGWRAIGR